MEKGTTILRPEQTARLHEVRAELPAGALWVYLELAAITNLTGLNRWRLVETLAGILGEPVRTVRHHVLALERAGLVARESGLVAALKTPGARQAVAVRASRSHVHKRQTVAAKRQELAAEQAPEPVQHANNTSPKEEGKEVRVTSFSLSFQTPSLTVNAPRERDETPETPAAAQVEQVTTPALKASKPARPAREKVARAAEPVAPLPSRLANTPGFLAAWTDWREHLRAKKKPLTPVAERRQLARLERSPDPVLMLEHSMSNNWQGLYEPDPPRSGRGPDSARGQARADAGMLADYQRTLAALSGIN